MKYGGIMAGVGAVVVTGASFLELYQVMWVGLPLFILGAMLLFMAFEKWYCAACGQYLSRGRKPNRCDRCGSNRVTNDDPGAGRAVRIEN